jgi:bifunctional non-homologous end joining protein LigD
MLASPGPLPKGDMWTYEVKWDGYRALVYLQPGEANPVTVMTRAGNDASGAYPELRTMAEAIGVTAVLDGEVVAFDEAGLPSFHRLQSRGGVGGRDAELRVAGNPVVFVAFDLLHLNGLNMRGLPLVQRRQILEQLDFEGAHSWRLSTSHADGAALHAATLDAGLEGVIAKRLDSPYSVGVRSPSWVKVKHLTIDEFIIGGWVPGEGRRERTIGALLLGMVESDDESAPMRWIGKVGTGFTDAELDRLYNLLAPDKIDVRPFHNNPGERTAVYVSSRHTCRVEYREWSPSGTLRFPSYKGLVIGEPKPE